MASYIGIDIIEVNRMKKSVKRWNEAFLKKLFTPAEIKYCRRKSDPYPHFAARFAAKEALLKAFSNGWQGRMKWTDMEIINDEWGKPEAVFTGFAKTLLKKNKITNVQISLSHDRLNVVACALMERSRK